MFVSECGVFMSEVVRVRGRWLRAARLQALAREVLGSDDKALQWLHKPRRMFDQLSAMELMKTEAGAQLVEEVLSQLDAGYFA